MIPPFSIEMNPVWLPERAMCPSRALIRPGFESCFAAENDPRNTRPFSQTVF